MPCVSTSARKVLGRIAAERGLGEMRVGREIAIGCGMQICEVAAPAARDQDLLARLVGHDRRPARALPRCPATRGAHEACAARTEHDRVVGGWRRRHRVRLPTSAGREEGGGGLYLDGGLRFACSVASAGPPPPSARNAVDRRCGQLPRLQLKQRALRVERGGLRGRRPRDSPRRRRGSGSARDRASCWPTARHPAGRGPR